jgi:lipopolysaccharide export system permease protein
VIKKLDILVIKAFIGPFIATFFITLFVLLMQFFWLYIDDFVGKGLSLNNILTFIWYQLPGLSQLALPLAVLLSCLMTFGNLGESMELVAVKSSGISLLRFMRPLGVIVIIVCGLAFLLANNLVPIANLKSKTMLGDIAYAKPAFDLKEGVFYDRIENFAIKVGKKEKDSIIKDVIIFERTNPLQDNFIIAKSGVMSVSEDKRFLNFNLKDGWRYQERGAATGANSEYIRLYFKEYKKQFDLIAINKINWTNDTVNKSNEMMKSLRQLNIGIDSIEKELRQLKTKYQNDLAATFKFAKYLDSSWEKSSVTVPDSVKKFETLIPDSAISNVRQQAISQLSSARINNDVLLSEYENKDRNLRKHNMEWHRKFSLSFACFVLFLIGAPLGSIIRKGGLGTPLVFAIMFFIFFYFTNRTGEQMAKTGKLSAMTGLWLADSVLLLVGIFLTYKALRDSQLLNKEFYHRSYRKIKTWVRKK